MLDNMSCRIVRHVERSSNVPLGTWFNKRVDSIHFSTRASRLHVVYIQGLSTSVFELDVEILHRTAFLYFAYITGIVGKLQTWQICLIAFAATDGKQEGNRQSFDETFNERPQHYRLCWSRRRHHKRPRPWGRTASRTISPPYRRD